ncbi:MAG: sterol desaturase family protein [Sphingomonadaceae bacterium]|nr:sterol desaturase family protein [Sphingomonadaceae bacterium]
MDMLNATVEFLGGPYGIYTLGGFYFGIVLLERLYVAVKGWRYNQADAWCSVGLNMLNSVIDIVIGMIVPLAIYTLVYEQLRIVDTMPLLLALLIAFLVHELSYYWEHRLSHRIGLFWAFHAIHHSSNEFNHTTAARGFWLDGLLRTPFDLVAALLGVPPVVFLAITIVKNAFGIWNHASYVGHLGWFEQWLATPLNHKIHHANQPQYIDKNYSQVLIVWDRIFGSHAPLGEHPVVGLVKPVHDNNPLTAQFAGLQQLRDRMAHADRWQDKLAYLWRPPEWSHDGVCRSDCPKYAGLAIS